MTDVATSRRPLSEWSRPPTGTSVRPRTRADSSPREQTRRPSRAVAPPPSSGARRGQPPRRGGRTQPSAHDAAALRRLAQGIPAARSSAAPAAAPREQPQAAPPESTPRHLRVVGPRQRSTASLRRRARLLVLIGSLAVTVVAFGLVYLHVLSAQKQFELDRLTTTEQAAQQRYEGLRSSVEAENSPARIMAEAGRLHLVEPSQIIPVRAVPGGTVTAAADPAAASGSTAPGGVANWSRTKSDLVGAP